MNYNKEDNKIVSHDSERQIFPQGALADGIYIEDCGSSMPVYIDDIDELIEMLEKAKELALKDMALNS